MSYTTYRRAVDAPSKKPARDTPARAQRLYVVCLSSQPWGVDLPTNRQQIMARVAQNGHRVFYVETGQFVGRHVAELLRGGDRRALFRQLVAAESPPPGLFVTKAPTLVAEHTWETRTRRLLDLVHAEL